MQRRCTSWCVVIGLVSSLTVSNGVFSVSATAAQSPASPTDPAPPVPPPFDIDAYVQQMWKPSVPLALSDLYPTISNGYTNNLYEIEADNTQDYWGTLWGT